MNSNYACLKFNNGSVSIYLKQMISFVVKRIV